MKNKLENDASASAYILCMGAGWFPKTPGGLERYVYELTQKLATRDRIELCGVGLPEGEQNLPLKLTNLGSPDSLIWHRLWSIRKNFKKTRTEKPDAINLHFALYSFPILDLLPKGVPITFNFHGPWAYESKQEVVHQQVSVFIKHWLIEKRTYNRCDRFIVLSKAFGRILHQKYYIPWHKIHIIPGGVNTDRFQPSLSPQQARSKLGWPQDRSIIFTTRRLVCRVGIDKLLEALAKIKPRISDFWLAIAGRGHMQQALEKLVTELELNNHVKFLGFLPDEQLPIAYQAADITVMPSQSFEGFGLAIVESLACGTPVLSTPVGGMPEILEPFSPQLITSSPTAAAIAEKLEQVLLKTLPTPSREDCRQYAVANFDWQKIAELVRKVILGLP